MSDRWNRGNPSGWFVGFYSWVVTVFFGAILLDVVYSDLLTELGGSFEPSALFARVSDFLLLIGGVTLLSGIAATGISWNSKPARFFFLASLLLVLVELSVPVLVSQFFRRVPVGSGFPIGPAVRLFASGLASILAFLGLSRFYSSRSATRKSIIATSASQYRQEDQGERR